MVILVTLGFGMLVWFKRKTPNAATAKNLKPRDPSDCSPSALRHLICHCWSVCVQQNLKKGMRETEMFFLPLSSQLFSGLPLGLSNFTSEFPVLKKINKSNNASCNSSCKEILYENTGPMVSRVHLPPHPWICIQSWDLFWPRRSYQTWCKQRSEVCLHGMDCSLALHHVLGIASPGQLPHL